jgi:thiamine-phosphate pyrophosphorylase
VVSLSIRDVMIGRLHVLTDFHLQQRYSHSDLAGMAIEGGADMIQFRQKNGNIRHIIRELQRTAEVCAEAGVSLLVNDRIDLAFLDGASGVHLGQTDYPIDLARRVLGDNAIIGATATTTEQARRAEAEGASYIGFGPVYPTGSKANPASVKGLHGLRRAVDAVSIPVIAIAGISVERIPEVLEAGAHGVAVMTAVTNAKDPVAATRELADALRIGVSV